MKNLKFLAIDLGASSGRGIVGIFDGKKIELKENHRFTNDPVMVNGRFTWDIIRIFHEIKNSIRKAHLDGDDIVSIGIDTWGVDYGFIDRHGRMIGNPTHYRDVRTEGICEYVDKQLPLEKLYGTTGIQSLNFNTIYQLAAEKRDNPEIFDIAEKMLFIPDLLGYFLTGKAKTEYTIASTGAILDAHSRTYATELLEALGIPAGVLTDIVEPGYNLGKLLPDVKEEVGGVDADIVKVASHDTASAVLAVPAKSDDFVYISSGTWSLMGMELKAPLINEKTRELNYTNEGGVDGTIRFLKNIMGLWILQESRRQWMREGKEYSFSELSELASKATPLQSIIDPDDQLFATQGNMPRRIAEYCERTGQHVPESVGETVRCILDSLALRYRYTVADLSLLSGKKVGAINIVGGGTQNTLLCQITADACGVPVCAGPVEATAIGNIMTQLMACGEVKSLAQAREIVANSFDTVTYEPSADSAAWDAAFAKFCELIK